MGSHAARISMLVLLLGCTRTPSPPASPGGRRLNLDVSVRHQTIDGFGTTGPSRRGDEGWVHELYFDELGASILRIDLTPAFKSPYSDHAYNSPWFHGSPALPGPDQNNVRAYKDAADYQREWSGRKAQIAVMGPDIEQNLALLDFAEARVKSFGDLAAEGAKRAKGSDEFKLIGSLWSPAPWLKRVSGGRISGHTGVLPKDGAPWPFIWAGNFAGGSLDVSGQPRPEFDDRAHGGTGPTSALTQFARGLAAYLLGFQRTYGVRFYAISIQNELGFETFYNSCSYLDTGAYLKALKAARAELDKHPELSGIRIMGPEDLLGSSGYSLWQYGGAGATTPKNLQFLRDIARDPQAEKALDFFCVHGYAPDGVTGTGGDPKTWRMWAQGWKESPAAGLPDVVQGFRHYRKKSWMTETSGEPSRWSPATDDTLNESALGLALKVHQALTEGDESAWVYWQLLDDDPVSVNTLTDATLRASAPKLAAAKHYFRFIRPGATRVQAKLEGGGPLHASAFLHDAQRTLTVVLVHPGSTREELEVRGLSGDASLRVYRSDEAKLWQASELKAHGDRVKLSVPPKSVLTLVTSRP